MGSPPYEGSSADREEVLQSQSARIPRAREFRLRLDNEVSTLEVINGGWIGISWSRLAFLGVMSLCLTGNYFAYDLPAALNRQMKESLDSSPESWQLQLALLYSAYSLPNVFLPFLTARFVDILGSRFTLCFFSLLVLFGQYLVATGLEARDFRIMIVGRVLLGVGGESIGISQARITCRWFQESRLSFALSVNMGVARLGSVLSYVLSPYLVTKLAPENLHRGTVQTTWIGFLCCLGSAFCALLIVLIDVLCFRRQTIDGTPVTFDQESSVLLRHGTKYPTYGTGKSDLGARLGRRAALPSNWISGADPEMRGVNEETRSINLLSGDFPRQSSSILSHSSKDETEGFGMHYWCICFVIICYYGSVIPFTNVASDFLQQRWYSDRPHLTGVLLAIPDLLSTILVPVIGRLLAGAKERFWATGLAGVGVCFAHGLMAKGDTAPVWLMIGLGLSYALFAASLWSLIPLVVPEIQLSVAYSTSTCLLNAVLALGPFLVALLVNVDPTYFLLEFCLSGLGFLGAITASVLLWLVYRSETYMLPSEQEEAIADDYESVEEEVDLDLDASKEDEESWPTFANDAEHDDFTPGSSLGLTHSPSGFQYIHPPVPMAGFPGSVLQAAGSNESLLSRQFQSLSLSRSGSVRSRLAPRPRKTPSKSSIALKDVSQSPLASQSPLDSSTLSLAEPLPGSSSGRVSWSTFPRPPLLNRRSGLFYSTLQSQLDPYPKDASPNSPN